MPKKSDLGELLEGSFKNPLFGLVASIILAGAGFCLSHLSGAPGTATAMASAMGKGLGPYFYLFAGLVSVVSAVGYLVSASKRKRKETFFDKKETLEDLRSLSWKEFEEIVGYLFRKMGHAVEVTGGMNDGGIDLVVRKDDRTHYVQCKKYRTRQVTLSMLRDFYGAMASRRNFDTGYFITTGHATLEAKKFAEDNSIEVIEGPRLVEYLKSTEGTMPPVTSGVELPLRPIKEPVCPECGAPMVVRVAKKGRHANKPFWGCSKYPKCRAIVAYTERAL